MLGNGAKKIQRECLSKQIRGMSRKFTHFQEVFEKVAIKFLI